MSHPISPMLRLFRDGAASYQPEIDGLAFESGDPHVSRDNLQRMIDAGLVVANFMVRPTGVLVLFATGEQYYAPAFASGPPTWRQRPWLTLPPRQALAPRSNSWAFTETCPRPTRANW